MSKRPPAMYLSGRKNGEDELRQYARTLEGALRDLHSEVEMAESVGVCLSNRVPSLRAGELLSAVAALATTEGEPRPKP